MSSIRLGLASALLLAATTPAAGQVADSTLAAACAGGGRVADGLLLVVFGNDVSAGARAAIAREVGGRLAGSAAEGGEYLLLPEGALPPDAAADRLILQAGVQAVGEAACPPPPPAAAADAAGPNDTAGPNGTAGRNDTAGMNGTAADARADTGRGPPTPGDTTAAPESAAAPVPQPGAAPDTARGR